ncbi:Bax inhibitor-1/YccA family protein [Azospirillaceae bacterium]
MSNGWYNQSTVSQNAGSARAFGQAQFDEGLRQHMLRVYNYMMAGLVVTGLVAGFVASDRSLMIALFGSPVKWLVMLAPFAFVLALSFGIQKMSYKTAQMVFWAYSATMGLSLSVVFLAFTGASVARVFFITAGTFAAMSLWGYTTRRNLTNFGGFLMMGLFGVVIAGFVNMFMQSTGMQFAISVISVLVFTGLTAYDTQSIKEMYSESYDHESAGKLALMGALTLYLDFINLFMSMLRLLGDQNRD